MIKVYQAEWCPNSHLIRQRLTELGVTFLAIPVSTIPESRIELIDATGQNMIPALILEDGRILSGKNKNILAELDKFYPETPETNAHKEKAVKNKHKFC